MNTFDRLIILDEICQFKIYKLEAELYSWKKIKKEFGMMSLSKEVSVDSLDEIIRLLASIEKKKDGE